MRRPALWLAGAYLAGALTATGAIANHGVALAQPLFAVATWLANASTGATYEVAITPEFRPQLEPARMAPKGKALR